MIPQDPSEISRLRISDADRDRAASILNEAFADGRLTPEEHSERLDGIYAAKTQADIVPLVSDLPGASSALARPSGDAVAYPTGSSVESLGKPSRMVCVFSGASRKGSWRVPAALETINVFGGTELDLREAVLPAREISIRAICVFGGVDITVPPEMHVIDTGWALLGGREIPPDTDESAEPDAPVLRISGLSVLGGMSVRRKRRKGDRPRQQLPR
jgi:Domain of unknown function (DUF1707)/Cell wall-active antibiotics response 4TMS YvqF